MWLINNSFDLIDKQQHIDYIFLFRLFIINKWLLDKLKKIRLKLSKNSAIAVFLTSSQPQDFFGGPNFSHFWLNSKFSHNYKL
jgi:hypothetical protein